jgi:hypothetical protein
MSRQHVAHRLEVDIGCVSTFEGPASKKCESSQSDKETLAPKPQPHSVTLSESTLASRG